VNYVHFDTEPNGRSRVTSYNTFFCCFVDLVVFLCSFVILLDLSQSCVMMLPLIYCSSMEPSSMNQPTGELSLELAAKLLRDR